MEKIRVIVADADLVYSSKRDENEERSQEKGFELGHNICCCCGKGIKNMETAKQLHLIEGGEYFTEDKREINTRTGSEQGWWIVGPACYRKFLKNKKEVEIVNED